MTRAARRDEGAETGGGQKVEEKEQGETESDMERVFERELPYDMSDVTRGGEGAESKEEKRRSRERPRATLRACPCNR